MQKTFFDVFTLTPVPRRRSIAITVSVCLSVYLSVCLSIHEHIYETTRPIFAKFLGMLRMSSGGVAI